jgi:hypothetical protein
MGNHAVEHESKAAEQAPSPLPGAASMPATGAQTLTMLQRTAGNAAVTRLLQRQANEDQRLAEAARAAIRRGGTAAWRAAARDILQSIVQRHFPAEASRFAATGYDENLVPVRLRATNGSVTLFAGDTLVRWVRNGYMSHAVQEVGLAFTINRLERDHSLEIRDGSSGQRGRWSVHDIADLETALTLLTAEERARLSGFHFIRRDDLAEGDALTTVEGNKRRIQIADMAFGREALKDGGMRVYGRPVGVHAIIHECGHGIEFQTTTVLPRWQPIFGRLQRQRRSISSQPKGNPETNPDFEVFAEAFARFHTDPTGLRSDDAPTADFFNQRNHLRR